VIVILLFLDFNTAYIAIISISIIIIIILLLLPFATMWWWIKIIRRLDIWRCSVVGDDVTMTSVGARAGRPIASRLRCRW